MSIFMIKLKANHFQQFRPTIDLQWHCKKGVSMGEPYLITAKLGIVLLVNWFTGITPFTSLLVIRAKFWTMYDNISCCDIDIKLQWNMAWCHTCTSPNQLKINMSQHILKKKSCFIASVHSSCCSFVGIIHVLICFIIVMEHWQTHRLQQPILY